MDPLKEESKLKQASAKMSTIYRTLSPPDINTHNSTSIHTNGNAVSNNQSHASELITEQRTRNISSKYWHVAAAHSKARSSCLSHDAESNPSFLGFRNLMVIVLSMWSSIFNNYDPHQERAQIVLIKTWFSCNESTTGR